MHLERLVGSEVRVKVLRTLFQDALPQLDAVALAKETGKSVSGVHKALSELVGSRILATSVVGRTTRYGVDPTHPFYAHLLDLFRRERDADNVPHLFPTYWNHLENVVSWIASAPAVKAVVLFGSFTRAPIYPTADVDLLVVGARPFVGAQTVLGHEVQLTVLKADDLAAKVRSGDDFAISILERHLILYRTAGYELPWEGQHGTSRLGRGVPPRRRGGSLR